MLEQPETNVPCHGLECWRPKEEESGEEEAQNTSLLNSNRKDG